MWIVILLLFFALNCEALATLDREIVPAIGTQSAILEVDSFGRYTIIASSKQGTALQLVDRMVGPGEIDGIIGEKNGRIDTFLDRGTYKVLAHSDKKGKGEARIVVHSFRELNSPQAPTLVELKLIQQQLRDLEQISYWIHIKERRSVVLEASGRSLVDLRLWKDGNWLVDASPQIKVVQPKKGKPLVLCQLVADLNPGLYLLTAYGGLAQPWAEDTPEHPFFLRFGIPKLSDAGRNRFVVSPFGTDYWLVPGNVTYFRVELPEARPAAVSVAYFENQNPFQSTGPTASIHKNSVPPAAELIVGGDPKKMHLVKIEAEAEQPYILQQFELRDVYTFQRDGKHWISTLHSGTPTDSVDASGILVQYNRFHQPAPAPVATQVILLDQDHAWSRRFNLLDTLTLFFEVKQKGKYQIESEGADARFRFEPFLLTRPEKYNPPSFAGNGSIWDLDSGYYVLTVTPAKTGILELTVKPSGMLDSILNFIGVDSENQQANVRASVRFSEMILNLDYHYTLFLNQQPGVRAGLILRSLPVDLTQSLYVTLQRDETVTVPAKITEQGTLSAQCENGSLLTISLDGKSWKRTLDVPAGLYTLYLRNTHAETVGFSLQFVPHRLQPTTPLPPLPDPTIATQQKFEVVAENSPQHFDLKQNSSTTFVVNAKKPALYRLETTGLLDTTGNLRTRTIPSFIREGANGTGRNFLIQQYLREGDYQITVAAEGTSSGHLGLQLSRNKIVDGGVLQVGNPVRISVPAGQAVVYNFNIFVAGDYSLQSFGIGKTFAGRLEDADGWPVEKPNIAMDLIRHFEVGKYQLTLLPDALPTRRITLLKKIEGPLKFEGHGPHALKLGQRIQHQWIESKTSRQPDVWRIVVPAALDANITLTAEMQADLLRVDDTSKTKVAYVPPQRGWKGHLEKGAYQLEVTCVRRNNRLAYELEVEATQLVAGTEKRITTPMAIPVSVGSFGLVEFTSFGREDVTARLMRLDGTEIAGNDDRTDDWNFHFSQTLTPGNYQLELQPVGTANVTTLVSMRAPQEIQEPALNLPSKIRRDPGDAVHVYPLKTSMEADLLLVSGKSEESIGVALEVLEVGKWKTIATVEDHIVHLETPCQSSTQYRLRVWSVDHRGTTSQISVDAIVAPVVDETSLQKGITSSKVAQMDPAIGVVAVNTGRAGLFATKTTGLRSCAELHRACVSTTDRQMKSVGGKMWIVADASNARIQASRVVLAANTNKDVTIHLSDTATVDLAIPQDGPVVAIAKSVAHQPSIHVVEATDLDFKAEEMAVADQAALAVALTPDRPAMRISSGAIGNSQLRVSHFSFPRAQIEEVSWGNWVGVLKGITTREYALPPGLKSIRITLDQNTASVLASGDDVGSVHWGHEKPYEEIIETTANRLLLFHLRSESDGFSIEALPLSHPTPELTLQKPYEKVHQNAGIFRMILTRSPAMHQTQVHVHGAATEAIWISEDGNVRKGKDVFIGSSGGTLLIRHKPGLVFSWMDSKEVNGLWGIEQATSPTEVHSPTTFSLRGKVQLFRVQTGRPVMLHMRSAVPVISRIQSNAGERTEVHEKGVLLDEFLADGSADVSVRALGQSGLWGNLEVTFSYVTNIVEGAGPEIILPAGGSASYSFEVKRKGKIGIGVRADQDIVEATLLDSQGKQLDHGVAQMPDLNPGTYILTLRIPSNGEPVKVRPVLVGIETPPSGPPEEVIREYLRTITPNPTGAAIPLVAAPAKSYEAADEDACCRDEYYYEEYSDE